MTLFHPIRLTHPIRLALCAFILIYSSFSSSENTEDIIQSGQQRLQENQAAQNKVNQVAEQTRSLLEEYHSLLKVVADMEIYNKIVSKQIANQEAEMARLHKSLADAAVIERQILPLLIRMLDTLETWIQLDLPFLAEERKQRIATLRRVIEASELTNAEKTRRVFEAFQIENDFGKTIESYKGKLDLADRTFDVDYLRIGRVALLYRIVGSGEYGYWSQEEKSWLPIESMLYKRNIDKGIKISRQEMAPELITVPLAYRYEIWTQEKQQ